MEENTAEIIEKINALISKTLLYNTDRDDLRVYVKKMEFEFSKKERPHSFFTIRKILLDKGLFLEKEYQQIKADLNELGKEIAELHWD